MHASCTRMYYIFLRKSGVYSIKSTMFVRRPGMNYILKPGIIFLHRNIFCLGMCLHESPGKSFLRIVLLFPGNLYYWPGIIFPRKSGTLLPRRELRRQCPRGFTWQYFHFNMRLTSKNCAFKNSLVYPTLWQFRKF